MSQPPVDTAPTSTTVVRRSPADQAAELDLFFRNAPVGVAFIDRQMRYLSVNARLASYHGVPVEEHYGKKIFEVIPTMANEVISAVRRVFVTGDPLFNHESTSLDPDGSERVWLTNYFPLRTSGGEIQSVAVMVLDISARKTAEHSLTVQKAYLEQLLELAPEAVVIVDTKNIVQRTNREFTNFFGYTPSEAIGRDLDELVVPEDRRDEGRWLDREAERGVEISIETVRRRKDGSRLEVSLLVAPIAVGGGQLAVYCIYRDITEQKRAEKQMRSSEDRYRRLVELSPDGVWIQHEGKIVFVNSACMKLLGASRPEQLIGKNVLDIVHPDYHDIVKTRMVQSMRPGGSVPFLEEKFVRLDGTIVDVEVAATSFQFSDLPAAQAIVHDLTDRKRAERDLLAAEAKFRLLVEQLPAITYRAEFGVYGRWLYVSPQIQPLLGYTPEEWMRDPKIWYSRIHPDDAGKVAEAEEKAASTGTPFEAEYRIRARDETYRWFSDLATVVHDSSGQTPCMQGVMMDITERKLLEAQLRQSQKMEAIGQLAGGIAHDFNNLLMVIRGHADMLATAVDRPEKNVQPILKAADRATSLIKQLLAFSRMQVLQLEILDMNDIVTELGNILPRLFTGGIEIITELEPHLGKVRADAVQVEQVILNLAVNARDAMPKGGKLTIRTANITTGPQHRTWVPAPPVGDYVALIISDTGSGMPPEVQARIFEPFFTTKEKGRGTGLGLATAYGIVKQSSGYIWVESAPNKGTTFTIYLPAVEPPPAQSAGRQTQSCVSQGTETVLVVDDEESIRDLATQYLTRCGYHVLTATDGADAKRLAEQHEGEIDILLTDTMMPNMNGRELVRAIRQSRPKIKIIYMSGYLEFNTNPQEGFDQIYYLQKPFGLEALGQKIKSVLTAEPVQN
jgi:two-component system, cell cycle sensor histidine kinase and response regulator CckA